MNFVIRNNQINKVTGFTLIEIMVATSIFIIIMLMAMGSLMIASDSSRKSQAIRQSMDNISFAMEDISRTLHSAKEYNCVSGGVSLPLTSGATLDCPLSGSGGSALAFTPVGHTQPDTAFQKSGTTIQRCDVTNGCVDIIAPNVSISTLKFFVVGSSISDSLQPMVYIIIKGDVTVKNQTTSFAIQTIVSQRSAE